MEAIKPSLLNHLSNASFDPTVRVSRTNNLLVDCAQALPSLRPPMSLPS